MSRKLLDSGFARGLSRHRGPQEEPTAGAHPSLRQHCLQDHVQQQIQTYLDKLLLCFDPIVIAAPRVSARRLHGTKDEEARTIGHWDYLEAFAIR